MSKEKLFEHTVGQGKKSENAEEEMLKAQEEFKKTQKEILLGRKIINK